MNENEGQASGSNARRDQLDGVGIARKVVLVALLVAKGLGVVKDSIDLIRDVGRHD